MKNHIFLLLKLVAATLMLQTLFFKFSGSQESIDLFIKVAGENEKLMRIGTGILELIASILLFIPKKEWSGAGLTVGLMGGAIFSHITTIGIQHNNDGGTLFSFAIITLISGIALLIQYKKDIPGLKLHR